MKKKSQKDDSSEENSAIIESIRNHIQSDKQPKKIEQGQQNKHIIGSNEYKQYQNKFAKLGQYGPSRLTINLEEVQRLINKHAGKGEIRIKNGKWDNKEIIRQNEVPVGVVVNNLTGKEAITTNFKIHYGKKGTHIVPHYPSKKE
jgi:hypothetical protein